MKPLEQCRLYTFVDTAYLEGRAPEELARELCDGGSDLIQLRAKGEPIDQVRRMAEPLLKITEQAGVWLVINDHPEVTRELGAPCCHLGQEDFFDAGYLTRHDHPDLAGEVRFGLSTHAPEQARRAAAAGADYLAVGPVYRTDTKPGVRPVTLDYVRWATAHLTAVPWFAIGGITLENAEAVLEAGARRICVVSAILRAPDRVRACQSFKARLLSISL